MKTLIATALVALTLGACTSPQQQQQMVFPSAVAPPTEIVSVQTDPTSTITVVAAPAQQVVRVVQPTPVRPVVQSVPTRRVLATVTPIPPAVGRTVQAEIDVPLKVGRAPPGAVRTSQANWDDPQFDCAAHGGTRDVNPSTGKWSCFIYDGPAKRQ